MGINRKCTCSVKDVKKHLSRNKQKDSHTDPEPELRPRSRPQPRPGAPSPECWLRPRLSSRFTKARRLPFLELI